MTDAIRKRLEEFVAKVRSGGVTDPSELAGVVLLLAHVALQTQQATETTGRDSNGDV